MRGRTGQKFKNNFFGKGKDVGLVHIVFTFVNILAKNDDNNSRKYRKI